MTIFHSEPRREQIDDLLRRIASYDLRRLELRTKRRVDNELVGNFKSAFRGSGLLFTELREYQPGDDVKHIHWKATARTSRVYVKSFIEDRALNILLVIDVSASVACRSPGSAPITAYERTIEHAALLGMLATRSNDALGLACISDRVESFSPPSRSRSQLHRIMRDLGSRHAFSRRTDLAAALKELALRHRRRSTIFLYSDFFSGSYEEQLEILARRHDVILCHLHASLFSGGDLPAIIAATDVESGVRRTFDGHHIGAHLAPAEQHRAAALGQLAARIGADFLTVTDNPLEDLHRLLQRRSRRFR